MNRDLLRHFQQHGDEEQRNLVLLEGGAMFVRNPVVADAEPHLKSGKQITIYKNPRFERCLEHTHEFVEMIYTCSGQTSHLVNGNRIVLRAGELLLLNLCARHENLPAGEEDIAVNFVILPSFFEITLGMMGDDESGLHRFLLGCLHNEDQAGGFLHFKVADVLPVQDLVEMLLWTFVHDVQNRRNINQFTMGLLFLHLINHTDRMRSGSKRDAQIFRILQYMEEHYRDGTLENLAGLLGYDVFWLSKNIRRLTGSTYKQLQQSKRISQAKFLLSTTGLAVKEIASQVGYSNSGYFYRLFEKQVGCSPGDFREKEKTKKTNPYAV